VTAASGQQQRRQGRRGSGGGVGAAKAMAGSSNGEAVAAASSGQGRQRLDGGGGVGVAAATAAVARGDGRWRSVGEPRQDFGETSRECPSRRRQASDSRNKRRPSDGDAIECPRVTPLSASGWGTKRGMKEEKKRLV
jgi:hypothetical protein